MQIRDLYFVYKMTLLKLRTSEYCHTSITHGSYEKWNKQNKRSWCNSQWVGRSGDLAHIRTGPGSHPASSTMCTGSLPWVKRPEGGTDHPSLPSAKGKERVLLYHILPIWAFMVCFMVKYTFTITQKLCSEN
jgi:hypothetical protein